MSISIRLAIAAMLGTTAIWAVASSKPDHRLFEFGNPGLYDSRQDHLWNRLHRHFRTRIAPDGEVFGEDEIDPLLWLETKYLLTGSSYQKAIELLDEFLNTRAERLVADPVKRAVFQHDLWAVFDWLVTTTMRYPPQTRRPIEARELQARLAKVIQRVALTNEQIKALPDTYVGAIASKTFAGRYVPEHSKNAFLPPEIFNATGPWVALNSVSGLTPLSHARAFSHSAFAIMINLPDGREATIDYLKRLWDFPQPFVADTTFPNERRLKLNPELPQLPIGTQVVLIRKMLLIDQAGEPVPSSLLESIQIRVFHQPSSVDYTHEPDFYGDQDFFEFRFTRRKLFARESGGLHAVGPNEKELPTFSSHGFDLFEGEHERAVWRRAPVVLNHCASCHRNPGIHSVLITPRLVRPNPFLEWYDVQSPYYAAADWKRTRYDWGLLQRLLEAGNASNRRLR